MQNKPRLTDDAILTGADGFVPTPRRQLVPISPFFEDEAGLSAIPIPKDEGEIELGSNTSSESSDDEGEDGLEQRTRQTTTTNSTAENRARGSTVASKTRDPASGEKRKPKPSTLTEVDLGGADPAPSMFSPAAGARVPISPFLDPDDTAVQAPNRVAQQGMSTSNTTRKIIVKGSTTASGASLKRNFQASGSVEATPPPPPPSGHSQPASGTANQAKPARSSLGKGIALKIDLTSSSSSKPASPVISRRPISQSKATPNLSSMSMISESLTSTSFIATADPSEWAIERRELQSRARRAEKRLAILLIASATRRRKEALMRTYFRRWRAASPRAFLSLPAEDDAQILADELLRRLRALRGEFS